MGGIFFFFLYVSSSSSKENYSYRAFGGGWGVGGVQWLDSRISSCNMAIYTT